MKRKAINGIDRGKYALNLSTKRLFHDVVQTYRTVRTEYLLTQAMQLVTFLTSGFSAGHAWTGYF